MAWLEISAGDFTDAQKFTDDILKMNLATVDRILISRREKDSMKKQKRVYNFICSGGKTGVTQTQLYKKFNMKTDELTEITNGLKEKDMIKITAGKTGKPGKAPTVYISTDFV